MTRRLSRNELKRKSRLVSQLIEGVVNDTIDIPDDAHVFLDPSDMQRVITPKRMELINLIKQNELDSVSQLADLAGRKKQAVNRDLRVLEKYEIVRLEKKGRRSVPKVYRDFILFPLVTSKDNNNVVRAKNGRKILSSDV